ncbi:type II toxin-antitoxin system prevent-host-death family antitoxin [Piscinibacter sp.]|uniref:type II toxin-antitoxin system prevent-host-death family antitoxin n=1 Tax=Piscinibacter sp. TaxID=1903157 RepID=UPI002CBB8F86|nr:type II toxin-antitoxin system prevent-host-death family antitoxin [Albitalea sp.]HUG21857.1 type II toxin-antitoxin system prevent-host-death family antitoxin [Albitalea sp.]
MKVSATEAKNRFGYLLESAQKAPVVIEKGGRRHSVLISAEQFDALSAGAAATPSLAQRRKEFNERHKDWIEEQNRHFDEHGLWNDDLRIW